VPAVRGEAWGCTVIDGVSVQVYRNLHVRPGVGWSVREARSRIVVAVVDEALLAGADFHVGALGRARVLREKRKNVHAWIAGRLVTPAEIPGNVFWEPVLYDPYRHETFVRPWDAAPVLRADWAKVCREGAFTGRDFCPRCTKELGIVEGGS